jgi:predicted tellurium resistance membrane protein TerC
VDLLDILLSLSALIILEIILGIDNLVFLSILSEKLPREQRKSARRWGLTFAWVTRLILLASAVWIVKLTRPLFTFMGFAISLRDVFLLLGGMFLIVKATQEIHHEIEEKTEVVATGTAHVAHSFVGVIVQIGLMDIIFSLDSVLTAVGLTQHFWVMAVAITCAIIVMIFASEPVSHFIEKHPTLKMLALSFLILIGMVLAADALSFHIPRGYIYFAMGFSLGVEALNLYKSAARKRNLHMNKD